MLHYAQAAPADSSTTMVVVLAAVGDYVYSISFHGLSRLPRNASRWLNSESKSTKRATLSHLLRRHSVFCFNAQAAVYNQHACWWYRTCRLLFIFLCHNFQMLYTEQIACCSCSHYCPPRKHTLIYTYLLITQRHYSSWCKSSLQLSHGIYWF